MLQEEFILEKQQIGKRIHLQVAHDKSIDAWIAERHYLGCVPAISMLRVWILSGQRVIGAMLWNHPTSQSLDQERIFELTRMVFLDDTERFVESRALSLVRKWIRKRFPRVKLVLAYSSSGEDHRGTVYAADNWCPFGKAKADNPRCHREGRVDRDLSEKTRWVRSP